jgi:hypothetical protein
MQLFTGVGDEEGVIKSAATPGMITITTSTLGRNTDILYPRVKGMSVVQTSPDSIRGTGQKGGRTGRQGSPGDVHFAFNQQEMGDMTLEQMNAAIDLKATQERAFNEDLYNVLGYFLALVDSLPQEHIHMPKSEFYRKVWATFTDEIELSYRESRLNDNYSQESFVEETTNIFSLRLREVLYAHVEIMISAAELLKYLKREAPKHVQYAICQTDVKISDCTPASVMAYQFIPDMQHEPILTIAKEDVKNKLNKLFISIQKGEKIDVTKDYFDYVNSNSRSREIIREAHQEFLSGYISAMETLASCTNAVRRFTGVVPQLNKIANNKNYLFMFKAMTDLNHHQAVVTVEEMKPLLIIMLEQYLDNSWFVNSERKRSVAELKMAITNAQTIDDIFSVMSHGQAMILSSDIAANKNSFWRRIKPLNFSGKSRLQVAISDAMVLLSALTSKEITPPLASGLVDNLKAVTKNISELETFENDSTYDNYHAVRGGLQFNDKSNAKVVSTAMNRVLDNNLLFGKPVTMSRRSKEFQYAPKVDIEIKAVTNGM